MSGDEENRRRDALRKLFLQVEPGYSEQLNVAHEAIKPWPLRIRAEVFGGYVGIAPPPRDYNNLQREREARETRIKDLAAELDRLYARYQELEEQKRPLLQRLSELARAH